MADFYRSCDIFVFTSMLEGFGLPPLEAMACGIPVVTTECGGIRAYANDQNALIVPVGDVEALRQAILRLAGSVELRKSLREAGLQTAGSYSVEDMIERYDRLFSLLVADSDRSTSLV